MMDIISLMAEHQVSIQFSPKVIWMNKASSKVGLANPDICVKLKDYNTKGEALQAGLAKLGLIEA